jgi:hypothetical protein
MDFPQDADGDSLRLAVDAGSDMTRPMVIDFTVSAPNESSARSIARLVEAQGFDPSISDDGRGGTWSVYCSMSMLATYDGVVERRSRLNQLVEPHGGHCDGWVTFGNGGADDQ